MPKELFDVLLIKDSTKLKDFYSTLFTGNDLAIVNLKAEKAINSKAIVPENLIESNTNSEIRLKGDLANVYVYQKWFLLAKALLVADPPQYHAVIYDKLGYNPVEDEFEIIDNEMKLSASLDDDSEEFSKEEIHLNARAISLMNKFLTDEQYRAHFSSPAQYEYLINEATEKDPKFLVNSNKKEIVKTMLSDKMHFYNHLEEYHTINEIETVANSLRTKSQINELKDQNTSLNNQKTKSDNELSAKQNIRTLQQERDSKSIFWKIFRPISNLVSYVRLNNAKKDFKTNFIMPKLEKYKDSDNYNEKVENAINEFNEEIVSDRPLKSSVPAPKLYTAEELKNTKIEDIGSNKPIVNGEDFNKRIENDFEKKPELNESKISEPSNNEIKIDLNK